MRKKERKQVTYKKMNCKYCHITVEKVDTEATAVTCWKCTMKLADGASEKELLEQ